MGLLGDDVCRKMNDSFSSGDLFDEVGTWSYFSVFFMFIKVYSKVPGSMWKTLRVYFSK